MNAADALQYAIRALSARALTEHELTKKLRHRKVTTADIAIILERLREFRFVNDNAIATRAAEDTTLGRYGVKRKLLARGINQHLVEDVLQHRDQSEDLEAALGLLEKYQNRFVGERAEQKAIAFFMRRGFSFSVIKTALEQHGLEVGEEELE